MRLYFSTCLFFLTTLIFAVAPLEGKFNLAPSTSASQEEKDIAYLEARNKVINAVIKYENTPYRYGGISSSGLDCSGLIYVSFKDALGVSLPRSASSLYSWVEKIPFEKAQPGDLLFFKTNKTGNVSHVVLYLGNRRFIHAASFGKRTGVIYTTLDEGSWLRTYAGAGRAFPEISSDYQQQIITNNANNKTGSSSNGNWNDTQFETFPEPTVSSRNIIIGAAFAPTWKGLLNEGAIIRGFTSQLSVGGSTALFGRNKFAWNNRHYSGSIHF